MKENLLMMRPVIVGVDPTAGFPFDDQAKRNDEPQLYTSIYDSLLLPTSHMTTLTRCT
jgi:hypothetical protein